jgi:hypothetical protein
MIGHERLCGLLSKHGPKRYLDPQISFWISAIVGDRHLERFFLFVKPHVLDGIRTSEWSNIDLDHAC